jgi:hypothetical protein
MAYVKLNSFHHDGVVDAQEKDQELRQQLNEIRRAKRSGELVSMVWRHGPRQIAGHGHWPLSLRLVCDGNAADNVS